MRVSLCFTITTAKNTPMSTLMSIAMNIHMSMHMNTSILTNMNTATSMNIIMTKTTVIHILTATTAWRISSILLWDILIFLRM